MYFLLFYTSLNQLPNSGDHFKLVAIQEILLQTQNWFGSKRYVYFTKQGSWWPHVKAICTPQNNNNLNFKLEHTILKKNEMLETKYDVILSVCVWCMRNAYPSTWPSEIFSSLFRANDVTQFKKIYTSDVSLMLFIMTRDSCQFTIIYLVYFIKFRQKMQVKT